MRRLLVLIAAMGAGLGIRRWVKMVQVQAEMKAQEKLNEERRRFIRRLDHELKNPLTAMRVSLANLGVTDDPTLRQQIHGSINEQILRLTHLVSDLRKLAALDSGPVETLPIVVGDLLQQIVATVYDHPLAAAREFSAGTLPEGAADCVLTGDEDLLQLAVYNVLDNAMKFTAPGGRITLQTRVEDGEFVISVADNGVGIPEDDVPYIWEELYRSKAVHGVPGSGIGLAMVKTIIELHSGRVGVNSRAGHGTTVTLVLPIEQGS